MEKYNHVDKVNQICLSYALHLRYSKAYVTFSCPFLFYSAFVLQVIYLFLALLVLHTEIIK